MTATTLAWSIKRCEIVAVEHRQALTGIEHERDACLGELPRVIDHRLAAVRRDHAPAESRVGRDRDLVGMTHRAGMEGGDLVVVHVGRDVGLGGKGRRHLEQEAPRYTVLIHPGGIGREIVADRAHRFTLAAEQLQIEGDVAGAAAELAAQLRHQKRHVQHMDLIRQDLIARSGPERP